MTQWEEGSPSTSVSCRIDTITETVGTADALLKAKQKAFPTDFLLLLTNTFAVKVVWLCYGHATTNIRKNNNSVVHQYVHS